jgi:methionyl-tRNA formyltransferase
MPLDYYCENVDTILIKNLSDPTLREILTKLQKQSFLYTGGGILPQSLLSIPQHRFTHVHPGYLPDIRGADCTLWSSIIAGCTSATCFYMAPGIDTGDIILARCLPKIKFKIDIRPFDLKLFIVLSTVFLIHGRVHICSDI